MNSMSTMKMIKTDCLLGRVEYTEACMVIRNLMIFHKGRNLTVDGNKITIEVMRPVYDGLDNAYCRDGFEFDKEYVLESYELISFNKLIPGKIEEIVNIKGEHIKVHSTVTNRNDVLWCRDNRIIQYGDIKNVYIQEKEGN